MGNLRFTFSEMANEKDSVNYRLFVDRFPVFSYDLKGQVGYSHQKTTIVLGAQA